jgi:hypothetical protein
MQISEDDATELYNICKSITIPLQQYKKYENGTEARGGRAKQFGNHRAALLGYTLARFKPRSIGPQLSYFSKKHPRLYECLVNISKKYFPEHNWKTIQLNHNVVCTPHIDKYNNGKSIICNLNTILYFLKNIDNNILEEDFLDTGKTIFDHKIVTHKNIRYISIKDFPSHLSYQLILPKFINTLNRRLKRFKNTIINSKELDFIHLLDMDINYDFKENPIFPPSKLFLPTEKSINELISQIKIINSNLNFTLHILVPPDYADDNIFFLNSYKKIKNVLLHYLTKDCQNNNNDIQCKYWSWDKVYKSLINHGNVFVSNNHEIKNESIYPHNFNVEDYKKLNSDLSHLPNHEALQHFKDFGLNEKRPYLIPQGFDYEIYLKFNKDLSNFNELQALQHFIEYGIKEKREYKLPDDFTIKNYKKFNKDLAHFNDEEALEHFINNGIKEKRKYNIPDDFDIETYKKLYDDLSNLNDPQILEHYINIGIKENTLIFILKIFRNFYIKNI